jgi:hypothetical protein
MKLTKAVAAGIQEVAERESEVAESGAVRDYERLEALVRDLESLSREAFQATVERDYSTIIDKLEQGGQGLTSEEREAIEQLIVGEAEAYVNREDDVEAWTSEVHDLVTELQQLRSRGVQGMEDLLQVEAICREARAILPDIIHYLRERERIRKFKSLDLNNLQPGEATFLADVIGQMITSPRV